MARAPALQAGGQGFDSLILHEAGRFKPSRVEARRPKFFDMMRREARRREEEAREYDSTSGKEGHHVKPRRHAGGQYIEEFNERGRAVDALAPGGEEGRDKPRKTPARCK